MHNTDPNCVWAASSFFFFCGEKNGLGQRAYMKKKESRYCLQDPLIILNLCKGLQQPFRTKCLQQGPPPIWAHVLVVYIIWSIATHWRVYFIQSTRHFSSTTRGPRKDAKVVKGPKRRPCKSITAFLFFHRFIGQLGRQDKKEMEIRTFCTACILVPLAGLPIVFPGDLFFHWDPPI